jgi:hypothetical protein
MYGTAPVVPIQVPAEGSVQAMNYADETWNYRWFTIIYKYYTNYGIYK